MWDGEREAEGPARLPGERRGAGQGGAGAEPVRRTAAALHRGDADNPAHLAGFWFGGFLGAARGRRFRRLLRAAIFTLLRGLLRTAATARLAHFRGAAPANLLSARVGRPGRPVGNRIPDGGSQIGQQRHPAHQAAWPGSAAQILHPSAHAPCCMRRSRPRQTHSSEPKRRARVSGGPLALRSGSDIIPLQLLGDGRMQETNGTLAARKTDAPALLARWTIRAFTSIAN